MIRDSKSDKCTKNSTKKHIETHRTAISKRQQRGLLLFCHGYLCANYSTTGFLNIFQSFAPLSGSRQGGRTRPPHRLYTKKSKYLRQTFQIVGNSYRNREFSFYQAVISPWRSNGQVKSRFLAKKSHIKTTT